MRTIAMATALVLGMTIRSAQVTKAARVLEARRLLLPADVQRYIEQAQASTVLR